jgi:hypothetical protein
MACRRGIAVVVAALAWAPAASAAPPSIGLEVLPPVALDHAFPWELTTGDLDGDGRADVVTAATQSVDVLLGRGAGTFHNPPGVRTFDVGAGYEAGVGDVTGDGKADVVVAGRSAAVLRGNGDGTLQPAGPAYAWPGRSFPYFDQALEVRTPQLDADVPLEVVVLTTRFLSGSAPGGDPGGPATQVHVLSAAPDGTLTRHSRLERDCSDDLGIAVGRFDAGGTEDLALACAGEVEVRPGTGAGAFGARKGAAIDFPEYADHAAGDLDGDGDLDVLTGSPATALGDGAGGLGAGPALALGEPWGEVEAGDLGGDARAEGVRVGPGGLDVLSLDGGALHRVTGLPAPAGEDAGFEEVALADLGSGPAADIAFLEQLDWDQPRRLRVALSGPAGTTPPPPPPPPGGGTAGVEQGGTPPPTTPVALPPAPVAALKIGDVATLPSNRRCVSRRRFRITLKAPKGRPIAQAQVLVNGRPKAVVRGRKLTAPVDLRGLPKGRFTVTIRLTLRDGTVVRGSRAFRTCAPKKPKRR